MVGEKRYNELYKKMKNNQIDCRTLKQHYTIDEIKAINIIEEILYEEGSK